MVCYPSHRASPFTEDLAGNSSKPELAVGSRAKFAIDAAYLGLLIFPVGTTLQ